MEKVLILSIWYFLFQTKNPYLSIQTGRECDMEENISLGTVVGQCWHSELL